MNDRVYSIVLADDVAALRRLVKIATEASGRFKVVGEAGTGIEAIARASDLQPDLVLLDLSMPELDGLEALPKVLEAAPKARVVVLSGFNHVRMEPVAKRMGASAYLEKGLEPVALVKALLAVLEPEEAPSAPASSSDKPPGGQAAPTDASVIAPARPARDAAAAAATAAPAAVPAAAPATASAASRPGAPAVARTAPQPQAARSGAPLQKEALEGTFRCLIVEADASLADRVARVLQQAGVRVVCSHAESLDAAAIRLEAHEADVVLIDPHGLGENPEDAFLEVLSRAPTVPVIALVDPADTALVGRALRLGIEDCIDPNTGDAHLLGRSLRFAVERRRAQDARRVVRDQQAELDRLKQMETLKTQFFNTAAHELGTPLTPIRLQLSLLRKLGNHARDSPEARSLEILERNVDRLARLNQDILDVARLQSGKLSIEKRPLDIKALVREAVDTFDPVARERGIGLTATCPDGLYVQADPQRIVQVLYNLVSNALKFTPRGGLIALEVDADDAEAHIQVRDSGHGLDADQIARLFQPFSQVLGADQPRGVGTGLGLFVSRGIVELHGGHIDCASPGLGLGSTFTFTLPRLQSLRRTPDATSRWTR